MRAGATGLRCLPLPWWGEGEGVDAAAATEVAVVARQGGLDPEDEGKGEGAAVGTEVAGVAGQGGMEVQSEDAAAERATVATLATRFWRELGGSAWPHGGGLMAKMQRVATRVAVWAMGPDPHELAVSSGRAYACCRDPACYRDTKCCHRHESAGCHTTPHRTFPNPCCVCCPVAARLRAVPSGELRGVSWQKEIVARKRHMARVLYVHATSPPTAEGTPAHRAGASHGRWSQRVRCSLAPGVFLPSDRLHGRAARYFDVTEAIHRYFTNATPQSSSISGWAAFRGLVS